MPFLVDSLAMVLNDCGLSIHTMVHPVFAVHRDRAGHLIEASAEATAARWSHGSTSRSTGAPMPTQLEHVR